MKILVTGGAGYVGSHAARWLERAGHEVWAYDNLSEGNREAVRAERLIVGDLMDREDLIAILRDKQIDAVMHFAAFAYVGESVQKPARYYQNNVVGTLSLMEAMRAAGISRIVFSSTCATYGVPDAVPITENEKQAPINPYGFTKLVIERALDDYAAAYGWSYAALRYFNAAGAAADGDIGEDHDPETHLIPLILQTALGQRPEVLIFGDDYPTADGTCIRDYIHVEDLASAHRRHSNDWPPECSTS
jgi:UDP-glucose 4-epimerase